MNNRIKNESDRLLLDQLLQIFPSYNDMWLRDLLIDYWHGHKWQKWQLDEMMARS